jgi:hypothetical protein
MEEEYAIDIFCGPPGQFFVSPVKRVPRLKRNNIFTPKVFKTRACLSSQT